MHLTVLCLGNVIAASVSVRGALGRSEHTITKTPADVCFEGYVIDRFCINRGTLLDNPQVTTLLNPELHSVHCLVDVGVCRDSGFEILAPLVKATANAAYCSAYRIGGASGFKKTLDLAREVGNKDDGCSTCTGSEVDKGFRAVFVGTASSEATWSAEKPPVLSVTQVLKAGSECPNGLSRTQPPCGGMAPTAGKFGVICM